MKEQDAAHSSLSVCPFCGLLPEWVNESLQDGHFYIRCPHCHIVMKEDRRDKVIGMWNRRAELTRLHSELQQAKQEIANHIAVNSLLTDSEGEADLANKLYKATSELQQAKEINVELSKGLESAVNWVKREFPEKFDSAMKEFESLIQKSKAKIIDYGTNTKIKDMA